MWGVDAVMRLEKELGGVDGVHRVSAQWTSDHEVRVGVVIDPDWDTRSRVIDLVDDMARENVAELSVDLDIVDPAHADVVFQHV